MEKFIGTLRNRNKLDGALSKLENKTAHSKNGGKTDCALTKRKTIFDSALKK